MPSLKIDIIVDDQGRVVIDKIKGEFQALDQSVRKAGGSVGLLESAFAQLGTKTEAAYNAQRRALEKAYQDARRLSLTDTDRERAAAAYHHQLSRLNAEQERSVRSTGSATSAIKAQNAAVTSHTKSLAALTSTILRWYAAYYVVSNVIGATIRALNAGMDAVENYKASITTMAALVTSSMELNPGENLAQGYERARVYATGLIRTMEDIDKHTSMNIAELTEMSQEMIRQRVILNTNNQEAVTGFTNVANALSAMIGNVPDRMRQINQETRALLTGQTRETDKLAKSVASMTPNFKEQLEIHKKTGDVWEWLGKLLVGFTAAQSDIDRSWQATKSTMETIWQQVLRGGFEPAYQDIIGYTKQLSEWALEHKDQLIEMAGKGYTQIKIILTDIGNLIGIIKDLVSPFMPLIQSIVGALYTAADGWGLIRAAMKPVVSVMGQYLSLAMDLVSYLGQAMKLLWSIGTFNWSGIKQSIADMGNATSSMVTRGKSIYGASINLYDDMQDSMLKRESLKYGLVEPAKRGKAGSTPTLKSFPGDDAAKKQKAAADQYANTLRQITDETTRWQNKISEMNPALERQDSEILKLTNDAEELIKRIQEQGAKAKVDVTPFISSVRQSLETGKEYIGEKERLKYHEEYLKMVSEEADFASTENERAINKIIAQEEEKLMRLADIWASGAITDEEADWLESRIHRTARAAEDERDIETARKIADINYNLVKDIRGLQDWAYGLRIEQIEAQADVYRKEGAEEIAIEQWKQDQILQAQIAAAVASNDARAGEWAAYQDLQREMVTTAEVAYGGIKNLHSGMKEGFASLFSGLREESFSWSDWFQDFTNRILSYWDNMLAEMLANWIMFGQATSGSGSSGGTNWLGIAMSAASAWFGGGSGAGSQFGNYYDIGGGYAAAAKGGVFPSTGLSGYSNSVVTKPTVFAFARGVGLMGEAGSEAIMPLTRTPSGDLGVKAVGGENGGTANIYHVTINAVDSKSFEDALKRNPNAVISVVSSALNNNTAGLRNTIKRTTR
ncbi:MAG: hypothetical protein A4E65_02317 [Syntrophorhabdus sp. PtaU1.Bin153]|nr:MAG: hypothetical protein A4E65_02317 [Syntrophorhabdus sp. PtaU1.Bin153]